MYTDATRDKAACSLLFDMPRFAPHFRDNFWSDYTQDTCYIKLWYWLPGKQCIFAWVIPKGFIDDFFILLWVTWTQGKVYHFTKEIVWFQSHILVYYIILATTGVDLSKILYLHLLSQACVIISVFIQSHIYFQRIWMGRWISYAEGTVPPCFLPLQIVG